MKHAMKRLVALLLILVMVIGMTACAPTKIVEEDPKQDEPKQEETKKEDPKPQEETKKEDAQQQTETTQNPPVEEPKGIQFPLEKEVTLTMMVGNLHSVDINKELEKSAFWQDLYKATNVKVEIIGIPTDDPLSTVNAMFQSGTEGDMILLQNTIKQDTDFCNMIGNGLFLDISEYVDDADLMPNLHSRIFAESPETRGVITAPDGGVYCLPTRNATWWSMCESPLMINKTWLDKAGMKVEDIKTIDDLEKVLTYFAENDMNGNGIDDEIPYLLCQSNNNCHVEAFCSLYGIATKGSTTEKGLFIEDGEVKLAYTSQNYKDAIKKLNDWYKKGLVWDQAFTATGNDFNSLVKTNTIGVLQRITTPTGGDEYVVLPPVSVPGYEPSFFVNPGIIATNKQVALTRSCSEPEIALAWLDQFYTFENSTREQYGELEDGRYEIVEGKLKAITLSNEDADKLNESKPTLQYLFQMFSCKTSEDYAQRLAVTAADETKMAAYKAYDAVGALNDEIWPRPLMTEEVASRLSELYTDLFNTIATKRASWVDGSADIDAEWDAYLADLAKMHVDEYVALCQEAYDVFNAGVSGYTK